jgi:hypothetical protein
MMRATVSVEPPAVKGTTSLTGFVGQDCAAANVDAIAPATKRQVNNTLMILIARSPSARE